MCFSDVIVFLKAAGFGKRDDAGAADDDAGQLKKIFGKSSMKAHNTYFLLDQCATLLDLSCRLLCRFAVRSGLHRSVRN